MATKKIITSEEFLKKKDEILNQRSHSTNIIPASVISFDEKMIANDLIKINGKTVAVSKDFFIKMSSFLNIKQSFTRNAIKRGDTKIVAGLLNGLKKYASTRSKSKDVLLIANPITHEIVDILPPGNYNRMTDGGVFDIAEKIMNDNPNMIIESIDRSRGGGLAAINFLNENEISFKNAGPDEHFKFGFSIFQSNRNTAVESYNQRLICTNGLRASLGEGAIQRQVNFADKFKLKGTSTEDIRQFLMNINELKKHDFIPPSFEQLIERAVKSQASLAEVEEALFSTTKIISDPDPKMFEHYKKALALKYFDGYGHTSARLFKKGVDVNHLSKEQKSFIKTDMKVWDVVNALTFLGSNDAGIPLENEAQLKTKAGTLFAKGTKSNYDLEFLEYAKL